MESTLFPEMASWYLIGQRCSVCLIILPLNGRPGDSCWYYEPFRTEQSGTCICLDPQEKSLELGQRGACSRCTRGQPSALPAHLPSSSVRDSRRGDTELGTPPSVRWHFASSENCHLCALALSVGELCLFSSGLSVTPTRLGADAFLNFDFTPFHDTQVWDVWMDSLVDHCL